jgi:hypothetical protein
MRPLIAWARANPAIVIGVSALAGWALGSGLLPISLPMPRAAPAPAAAPATAPIAPAAASFATSSASMPAAPVPAADPFDAYGI